MISFNCAIKFVKIELTTILGSRFNTYLIRRNNKQISLLQLINYGTEQMGTPVCCHSYGYELCRAGFFLALIS